jgi:predicted transposase YdaD
MPILNDIMDSEVLGPLIRQGRAEGRAEGRVEGRAEGQLELLLELTERRFGAAAERYRGRLAAMNPAELRAVGLRLLDAARIEDLFA